MKTTLKLYSDIPLQEENNFIIESFNSFLAQTIYAPIFTDNDFQFVKPALNTIIKVRGLTNSSTAGHNQDFTIGQGAYFNINYCSISFSANDIYPISTYYYFVVGKRWIGQDSLELTLHMDVLNTFNYSTLTKSNKTLVRREHKDRFESTPVISHKHHIFMQSNDDLEFSANGDTFYIDLLSSDRVSFIEDCTITLYDENGDPALTINHAEKSTDLTFTRMSGAYIFQIEGVDNNYTSAVVEMTYSTYKRKIHLLSEGITAPLYKKEQKTIYDGTDRNIWVLEYENKNAYDPSDPDSFTLNNTIECNVTSKEAQMIKVNRTSNSITPSDLPSSYYYHICYGQPFSFVVGGITVTVQSNYNYPYHRYCIYNDGTNFSIYVISQNSPFWKALAVSTSISFPNATSDINTYQDSTRHSTDYYFTNGNANYLIPMSVAYDEYTIGAQFINKTDTKIIKIIDLPYAPFEPKYDTSNYLLVPAEYTYSPSKNLFELSDIATPLSRTFLHNQEINIFNNLYVESEILYISNTNLRDDYLESKIYHSDYYAPKFVYDSFNLSFQLELMNTENLDMSLSQYLQVTYVISKNITSKFLFMFPQYTLKNSQSDYDGVVVVSRNNEEVVYNSQYLNYLRTGYNYDLKAKNRNILTAGLSLGLNALTTGLGFVTGNPFAIASGMSGIAKSTISYAKGIADQEQSMAEKMDTLQRQAVSVSNADDVELLEAYSENKAKICYYQVSDVMKQAMLDVFYYTGYITNERKIPLTHTRLWFNYLECDLVLLTPHQNMYEDWLDAYKLKFAQGVTFFHKVGTKWNLEQNLENYETWLL